MPHLTMTAPRHKFRRFGAANSNRSGQDHAGPTATSRHTSDDDDVDDATPKMARRNFNATAKSSSLAAAAKMNSRRKPREPEGVYEEVGDEDELSVSHGGGGGRRRRTKKSPSRSRSPWDKVRDGARSLSHGRRSSRSPSQDGVEGRDGRSKSPWKKSRSPSGGRSGGRKGGDGDIYFIADDDSEGVTSSPESPFGKGRDADHESPDGKQQQQQQKKHHHHHWWSPRPRGRTRSPGEPEQQSTPKKHQEEEENDRKAKLREASVRSPTSVADYPNGEADGGAEDDDDDNGFLHVLLGEHFGAMKEMQRVASPSSPRQHMHPFYAANAQRREADSLGRSTTGGGSPPGLSSLQRRLFSDDVDGNGNDNSSSNVDDEASSGGGSSRHRSTGAPSSGSSSLQRALNPPVPSDDVSDISVNSDRTGGSGRSSRRLGISRPPAYEEQRRVVVVDDNVVDDNEEEEDDDDEEDDGCRYTHPVYRTEPRSEGEGGREEDRSAVVTPTKNKKSALQSSLARAAAACQPKSVLRKTTRFADDDPPATDMTANTNATTTSTSSLQRASSLQSAATGTNKTAGPSMTNKASSSSSSSLQAAAATSLQKAAAAARTTTGALTTQSPSPSSSLQKAAVAASSTSSSLQKAAASTAPLLQKTAVQPPLEAATPLDAKPPSSSSSLFRSLFSSRSSPGSGAGTDGVADASPPSSPAAHRNGHPSEYDDENTAPLVRYDASPSSPLSPARSTSSASPVGRRNSGDALDHHEQRRRNDDDPDAYKIYLLLLDPIQKIFEICSIAFDSSTATVGDVLDLIELHASDPALGRQGYVGLIRIRDGEELVDLDLPASSRRNHAGRINRQQSANIHDGEVLVAIPRGCSPSKCGKLAVPILENPRLQKLLRRSDPLAPRRGGKKRRGRQGSSGGRFRNAESSALSNDGATGGEMERSPDRLFVPPSPSSSTVVTGNRSISPLRDRGWGSSSPFKQQGSVNTATTAASTSSSAADFRRAAIDAASEAATRALEKRIDEMERRLLDQQERLRCVSPPRGGTVMELDTGPKSPDRTELEAHVRRNVEAQARARAEIEEQLRREVKEKRHREEEVARELKELESGFDRIASLARLATMREEAREADSAAAVESTPVGGPADAAAGPGTAPTSYVEPITEPTARSPKKANKRYQTPMGPALRNISLATIAAVVLRLSAFAVRRCAKLVNFDAPMIVEPARAAAFMSASATTAMNAATDTDPMGFLGFLVLIFFMVMLVRFQSIVQSDNNTIGGEAPSIRHCNPSTLLTIPERRQGGPMVRLNPACGPSSSVAQGYSKEGWREAAKL